MITTCVNSKKEMNKKRKKKFRYSYSTVGYGVFSLIGEFYRMGRIEVYDRENESGFASDEGTYCMPFEAAAKFEDWIESIRTDFPMQFNLGSVDQCATAASKELGIARELLNDMETKKKFYNEKYSQQGTKSDE